MKNNQILVLGALAVGAWALLSKQAEATDSIDYPVGASALPPTLTPESVVQVTDPQGRTQSVVVQNSRQGVDLINAALRGDVKVNTFGETLVKPQAVATSSRGGNIVQGVERLASGSTVKIQVQQAARDSQGLSAMDRLIAKNKAASAARK